MAAPKKKVSLRRRRIRQAVLTAQKQVQIKYCSCGKLAFANSPLCEDCSVGSNYSSNSLVPELLLDMESQE